MQDYLILLPKTTEITGVIPTPSPLPAPSHLTMQCFNHFNPDIWVRRAENRGQGILW